MMRLNFFGLLLILAAGSIHAGDGVLEINAACRSAGCFSGDDPGAPIQITEPGSYILTSNVSVNVNTTAILIQTDDVTLDLNGFTIAGPVSCSGTPTSCSQSGLGIGIDAQAQRNITIRNGIVRGMGAQGVLANGRGVRIVDLTVTENSSDALLLGSSGALAKRVSATLNGGSGIFGGAGDQATVMDSHAIKNGDFGMGQVSCSNSFMAENRLGNDCEAILPNRCDDPTDCD